MRKNIYITTQGDMWDIISHRVYGTEMLMHVLIEANHQHRNIVVFPANVELIVPDVNTRESVTFPPWRAS